MSLEHAVAGAALIKVTGEYEWQLVTRDVPPTPDHSAYRGECYAVLLALQSFCSVNLHTDREAVVNEVQRMLSDILRGAAPSSRSHPDIWNVVTWQLRQRDPGQVTITIVKAHVDWRTLGEGHQRKCAFFNNAVDVEVKKAVAADFFAEWQMF